MESRRVLTLDDGTDESTTITLSDGYGTYTTTVNRIDMDIDDTMKMFIGLLRSASFAESTIRDYLNNYNDAE